MSLNMCAFMGRLTAEPELKATQTGSKVCSFTIAVDKKYASKGAERKANFFKCEAWNYNAEFISKHFHKGDPIAVQCEADNDNWTDRDGNKREKTKFVVENASFVPRSAEIPKIEPPLMYEVPDEEEMPF